MRANSTLTLHNQDRLTEFLTAKAQPQGSYFRGLYNDFRKDSVGSVVDLLTFINGFRLLQVVWGTSTLDCINSVWISGSLNAHIASTLSSTSEVLGSMSWVIYYTRLLLNIFRIVIGKSTFDELKYALANDFFWGTTNALGYFILKGTEKLLYASGLATAGLLLVDLGLNLFRYHTDKKKAHTDICDPNKSTFEHSLANLEYQHKKQQTLCDLIYSATLIVTWSSSCAFFVNAPCMAVLPLVVSQVLCFNLIGAIACFAISVINTLAGSYNEIAAAKRYYQYYENMLQAQWYTGEEEAICRQGMQDKKHAIRHHKTNLIRTFFCDIIIPSFLISLVAFCPPVLAGIPIMFVLLAAGLALSAASKPVHAYFFPKAAPKLQAPVEEKTTEAKFAQESFSYSTPRAA